MLTVRKANDRGYFDHGWLKTYHTFSFAGYRDPQYMGFHGLRVINEDWIEPGQGFDTHPHRNMEILSYVLEGALQHKDSMGNEVIVYPGEIMRMSAGSGITHSEFNHSQNDPLHLLQIWILPDQKGLDPSFQQKSFSTEARMNQLCLIASPSGMKKSLSINQDVGIYSAFISQGHQLFYDTGEKRHIWIQVANGHLQVNYIELEAGDGVAISQETHIRISGNDSEFLLFDLL